MISQEAAGRCTMRASVGIGTCLGLLCCMVLVKTVDAQSSDGPLGLDWGISKEAVEKLGIRMCCRQIGKWGARYEVRRQDFANFPRPLGDEEKVYLYFGNTNKLLRVYIDIRKKDGWNRYKQINTILARRYDMVDTCTRKTYTKYEALQKGQTEKICKNYESYTNYKKGNIEAFAGLERFDTGMRNPDYRVSVILLHDGLYKVDLEKKSPL
jgi:hypothetical protein